VAINMDKGFEAYWIIRRHTNSRSVNSPTAFFKSRKDYTLYLYGKLNHNPNPIEY